MNIYDIKQNIEYKRQAVKSELTPKRIYDLNPNYLSDKNIFEWNFKQEPKSNVFIGKANREMVNTVNIFKETQSPSENSKNKNRILKVEQHHKQ